MTELFCYIFPTNQDCVWLKTKLGTLIFLLLSTKPAKEFANNKSDAFFGYPERLNFILSQSGAKNVYISSAPIGNGKNLVLFVDFLVKRANCDQQCENAASKLAVYLNSPATQEWILMSKDSDTKSIPRYLIPATKGAFNRKPIRNDKYYEKINSEIKNALPTTEVCL